MANDFSPLIPLMGAFIGFAIFMFIALYVYVALVFMTIAKKLKYKKPWLAWIPIANFFLVPILAKKYWVWGFILFAPIINFVFYFIWMWKIYERRKYPGWLCLIPILSYFPYIGYIASIANLIILGFVAWKDR